jgi:hypothetical protein
MQGHTPKEPIPPPSRERPLQKSMFLPEQYPPPAPPLHSQQSNDHHSFNQLKRSLIENPSTGGSGTQYQFRTNTNYTTYQPPSATHAPFVVLDSRAGSHHELLHHSNSSSNLKHSTSFQRMDTPTYEVKQSFSKGEKVKAELVEIGDNKNLINEVVNQIKDKHLPTLISAVRKELHEEISQLRQEFLTLRESVKSGSMTKIDK